MSVVYSRLSHLSIKIVVLAAAIGMDPGFPAICAGIVTIDRDMTVAYSQKYIIVQGMCLVKYVTLKDIAEIAGVSINTVSRALHDKSDIGIETKLRIRAITEELGYIPDQTAARLRTKKKQTIGVVITHMNNSFYAHILQGIHDAISRLGYTMIALGSNENPDEEQRALVSLKANRVAGLIIVPSQDLINTLDFDQINVPHITIVRKGKLNTQSYFITDSHQSGVLVAGRFLDLDRTSPGYIGFDAMVSCNKDRLVGYKKTMEQSGIALPKEATIHCGSDMRSAYDATKHLLKKKADIDALFVYNDYMAIGVLRALHEMRIKVPNDISVIGHDDIDEASMLVPALSTVRVPKYSLGYQSASRLIHLIEKKDSFSKSVLNTPELIIRET
ncbi:MAG: LacI family transcriptional regulator [Spirochaetaceae bacterium]|nr:MAG: LacI family transcriptional regulator [Spirochaetaceae bacterium]